MKFLMVIALAWTLVLTDSADATVVSQSRDLVILQPQDLPELAQFAGQSMALHSFSNGDTYLYVEQSMGAQLAIFDVTDPAHIRPVGTVPIENGSAFDFIRDLNDSTTLICFRNNKGAAIVDFRKPKQPNILVVDSLRQATNAELIGDSGLLMAAQPRRDGDVPVFDYQVVDTSVARKPRLLITVVKVQQRLHDLATGATYLIGEKGLTVIRQPRVEERHRLDLTSN
jgi:hypothetical protein